MRSAELSVLVFGIYLAIGGLALLIAPEQSCALVGLPAPGDALWVRLAGGMALDVAGYCMLAARQGQRDFIRWTTFTRPPFSAFTAICGLVLHQPVLLGFAAVDLAATGWTVVALRARSDTPSLERGAPGRP